MPNDWDDKYFVGATAEAQKDINPADGLPRKLVIGRKEGDPATKPVLRDLRCNMVTHIFCDGLDMAPIDNADPLPQEAEVAPSRERRVPGHMKSMLARQDTVIIDDSWEEPK